MIRVIELVVSLIIVVVLAATVGALLPASGRVERSVEVSNPVRQIFDTVNTLRRFPEWSAERRLDPQMRMEFEGPRSGIGAGVRWTGNQDVGNGRLTVASTDQDSQVKMTAENEYAGTNKSYTFRIEPSENGRTSRIFLAYDVDYGWNLLWRYAGMYIHGKPDANIQAALANLSAMLASFPNVDYKEQAIEAVDIAPVPVLFVSTKAPRTLDDVALASNEATARIEAVMQKAGLTAIGPRRTITSNWADDTYSFDIAIPVNSATFTLNGTAYTIAALSDDTTMSGGIEGVEPTPAAPGQIDSTGYLLVEGDVRGTIAYGGKALVTEYTGSAAALPLLRLMEKAFAETHGYGYSEMDDGRAWDEIVPPAPLADGTIPEVLEGEETYRAYLPVSE